MSNPYSGGPPMAARPPLLVAAAASGLMILTAIASIVHVVLNWQISADVQRIRDAPDPVAAADSMPERSVTANDVFLVLSLLMVLAAVAFLVWLWQVRRVAEVTNPAAPQRHGTGWLIGGWFCPVLQFWYPLQAVADIQRAGVGRDPRDPGKEIRLLWWVSWAGHWVMFWVVYASVLLSGTGLSSPAGSGDFETDMENLDERAEQVTLLLNLGVTTLTVLLTAAAVLGSVLILRITNQQAKLLAVPPPLPMQAPPQAW